MNSETKAIIGGSVAGGILVLFLLSIGIYCIWKKKHKKRKDQKKHRPISPHASPPHSQHSSLHAPNPNLPKVNSTGLWIGTPSVYNMGPPPAAYHYARPNGQAKPQQIPMHIPRAISESKIPQQRRFLNVMKRPMFGSQNHIYMIPNSNSGQRIYHSQQLPPVFEGSRNPTYEVYDVYQFSGGPRSKMYETKYSPFYHNEEFRSARKPQRSQSDANAMRSQRPEVRSQRPEVRRDPNRQYRSPSNESNKRRPASRENSARSNAIVQQRSRENSARSNVVVQQRGSRNLERPPQTRLVTTVREENVPSVHVNRAFSPDTGEIVRMSSNRSNQHVVTSSVYTRTSHPIVPNGSVPVSGHSNKTDTNDPRFGELATDSMKLLAKNKTDDQKTIVPDAQSGGVDKNDNTKDNQSDNFINNDDVYAVTNKTKAIEDDRSQNPIITRMKEMVIEKSRSSNPSSPRIERASESKGSDAFDGLVLPEFNELDGKPPTGKSLSVNVTRNSRKASSSSPGIYKVNTPLSPRLSSDGEGMNEDGKRITESAFDFLDNYLSDDGDTVSRIDSPPLSPTGLRAMVD